MVRRAGRRGGAPLGPAAVRSRRGAPVDAGGGAARSGGSPSAADAPAPVRRVRRSAGGSARSGRRGATARPARRRRRGARAARCAPGRRGRRRPGSRGVPVLRAGARRRHRDRARGRAQRPPTGRRRRRQRSRTRPSAPATRDGSVDAGAVRAPVRSQVRGPAGPGPDRGLRRVRLRGLAHLAPREHGDRVDVAADDHGRGRAGVHRVPLRLVEPGTSTTDVAQQEPDREEHQQRPDGDARPQPGRRHHARPREGQGGRGLAGADGEQAPAALLRRPDQLGGPGPGLLARPTGPTRSGRRRWPVRRRPRRSASGVGTRLPPAPQPSPRPSALAWAPGRRRRRPPACARPTGR